MSMFANCQDARSMKTIMEVDCPECGETGGIEVVLQDGFTVGEGACVSCGHVIPEGINVEHLSEA